MPKTLKELIEERFGSINNFIALKLKEYGGQLPLTREYIYKIINHEVANPGIKSLVYVADMAGVPREDVYKEFTE